MVCTLLSVVFWQHQTTGDFVTKRKLSFVYILPHSPSFVQTFHHPRWLSWVCCVPLHFWLAAMHCALNFLSSNTIKNFCVSQEVNLCFLFWFIYTSKLVLTSQLFYSIFLFVFPMRLWTVDRDCSFFPGHPDPNNQTETILITTLLGILAQTSY